jgi:organic radical activating enzyme
MLIHSYSISRVNGPGVRFVLWTQGCSKGCKECYNPETWKFEGKDILVDEIFELIDSYNVDGITLTGGDPLEQEDI